MRTVRAMQAARHDQQIVQAASLPTPSTPLRASSCKQRKDGTRIIKGRPFRAKLDSRQESLSTGRRAGVESSASSQSATEIPPNKRRAQAFTAQAEIGRPGIQRAFSVRKFHTTGG